MCRQRYQNGCYLLGNDDLKAETSVNKEIGLEFHNEGWLAGVTYFRNDYHNKIEAGNSRIATSSTGTAVYQWENVPKAVVQGLEGSLNVPVSETVTWSNNATYMIENKNKTTGDYLSVIPKFTVNSTLSWQATQDLSMQSTLTWYGRQKPKKYNYQGKPATGGETREVSPYAVVGASATYDLTKTSASPPASITCSTNASSAPATRRTWAIRTPARSTSPVQARPPTTNRAAPTT